MLQTHSPSPSLSDLPIMTVHFDSYGRDQTTSSSISDDQEFSLCPDGVEFSFHSPFCKMPSVPCIADDIFLSGRLLPSDAQKPKGLVPLQEGTMDPPRRVQPRWYRLVFRLLRVPLPEMDLRDIRKRVRRKLANPVLETRQSSTGWKLIRSISCRAVESVSVAATATVPMSMV